VNHLQILTQPNDYTCGPTCLQAVYNFFDDILSLEQIIKEVETLEHGGTLSVLLANHALQRGYHATIYSYNVEMFDPSWFPADDKEELMDRLRRQKEAKPDSRVSDATDAYLDFLEMGGKLKSRDLTTSLLRTLFKSGPILTGLSATYLYNTSREETLENNDMRDNDIGGYPTGHFVVLHGFDENKNYIKVADPYGDNPVSGTNYYAVNRYRLINSIMLGIVTYDANLLLINPKKS
jgi:hypothetical protein